MTLLTCIACGKAYDHASLRYSCDCGGLLEAVHDFTGCDPEKLKRLFHERLSERLSPYASGVWRYKELILPELAESNIVTKYEGNTGLYEVSPAARYAGIRRVWLKAQSENPSGSFKDNGMTAAVSYGKQLGMQSFACTSTGNTSSSLAMYAAFGGMRSVVLVPESDVSSNKVLQTVAYGADVIRFAGTYDDGVRFLEAYGAQLGLYVCNSINPYRIEGQKSIVFELAQQLNWQLPDWIILPGGALSNAAALGKGLEELFRLGFITRIPRVAIVQAEGAAPFHRMHEAGEDRLIPVMQPKTRASALTIGNPPSWPKASRTLMLTNGVTAAVSDMEIMEAKALIDRSGIGCEPASAAALAGLRKLVSERIIQKEETAACILTGHILKDTEAIYEIHTGMWGAASASAKKMISAPLEVTRIQQLLNSSEQTV